MNSDYILKIENLSKIFSFGKTVVPVLKDVTLAVHKGEAVSVIGASGAGKSTLLYIIGGLDRPEGGSVVFDGTDIFRCSAGTRSVIRSRRIGFVFQFYHLLPELDVLENVMLPAMSLGMFSRSGAAKDRAMALLEKVGLAGRTGHLPPELSGGEQQRAALARALMNSPELMLVDEPTGNLDSAMGNVVLDCMFELSREKGSTLIMVTHNPAVAGRCDRVLKLEDGRLAF